MTNLDPISNFTLSLFAAHGAMIALGDALMKPLQLTSAKWQVLGAVALTDLPMSVAHIAKTMGQSRQATQRIVNELEAIGYIEFKENPFHKKAKLVVLTDEGQSTYQRAMQIWEPVKNQLLLNLTPEDTMAQTQFLKRIIPLIEAIKDSK